MIKKNLKLLIQALCLCLFCFIAAASSSQQSDTKTDWGAVGRSALIGAGAGHEGYDYLGYASSEAEAKKMAASEGYSRYLWDSNSGNVYAK